MSARRLLVVNPNTNARVTEWLAQEARRVADPNVAIDAISAESGFSVLETPEQIDAAADAVVQAILRSKPEAALIGAFGDPGLTAARALGANVAGLGESGLRAASAEGRFAILTLGAALHDDIAVRVEKLNLGSKLIEVRVLPYPIAEFVERRDTIEPEIASHLLDLAREGAGAVLLAGAPFAGLAFKLQLEGPVVLDGVESCLTELGFTGSVGSR